jgi:hypothetical protein
MFEKTFEWCEFLWGQAKRMAIIVCVCIRIKKLRVGQSQDSQYYEANMFTDASSSSAMDTEIQTIT